MTSEKAYKLLKKDFLILIKGLENNTFEETNIETVLNYLSILQAEILSIKDGLNSEDTFICCNVDIKDAPTFFINKENEKNKTDEETEKLFELLKKDISILSIGVKNKKLKEIDLNSIIEYLTFLKNEILRVKKGTINARNFLSTSVGKNYFSSFFVKSSLQKK